MTSIVSKRQNRVSAGRHKLDLKNAFPFLGLTAVLLFFSIATNGRLLSQQNMRAMLNDGLYILVASVGYLFMLAQGNLDFSIGANMGVSCAVCCIAANQIGVWASGPVAIITGSVIGLISSIIFIKGNISSFIVTLAMQFVLNGLVLVILNGARLAAPMSMLSLFTTPVKLGIAVGVVAIGYMVYQFTPFGKMCRAIGSCEEVVRQSGINTFILKVAPFVIMGALCGLLGFVSLIRTGTASNQTGSTLMMNVLNAVLLGGLPISGGPTAKFRAVIIGTLTMVLMTSGMTIMGLGTVGQQLVKGCVFLIAIGISFDRRNSKVIK